MKSKMGLQMFKHVLLVLILLAGGCLEAAGKIDLRTQGKKSNVTDTNLVDFAHWSRDKIFLKVGSDVLRWGPVKDYVDVMLETKPVAVPPGATLLDIEKARLFNERKFAIRIARKYFQGALLSEMARREGVSISSSKLTATGIVEKIVQSFPDNYQERVKKELLGPNTYLDACVTNTLLRDAYVQSRIVPTIKISDEEVKNAIQERSESVKRTKEYNEALKERMRLLLADLRAGKVEFSKAAEALSNCDSSECGGFWGVFEKDNSLLPEISTAAFGLSTNQLSDVIETARSYHILRVTAKPPEGWDEETVADDEEEKVNLWHIMFEKKEIPELIDAVKARDLLLREKTARQIEVMGREAMKVIAVESALPFNKKGK